MSELSDVARAPSRVGTGWSIAMLGMLGDATVDVVKDGVEEAANSAKCL